MKPVLSVLLIEDDPNVRLGCEQAMQLAGIPVIAVASAEEGQRHHHHRPRRCHAGGRSDAQWRLRFHAEAVFNA